MGGRGSGSMSSRMGMAGYDPVRMTGDPTQGFASVEDYNMAVHDYWTSDSYSLRHPANKMMKQMAIALDAEFDKQAYNGKIHRGLAVSKEDFAGLQVGATIDMHGMSSWTKSEREAKFFARERNGEPVVFVMPRGTKHGGDIQHLSRFYSEEEVALSSKSEQLITNVRKKAGFTYVTVEEI